MTLDEAQAICDGSNRIHFCSEPGFDQMVCIDDEWSTENGLAERIDRSWSREAELLMQAALTVLRANIARAAGQAELL